MRHDSAPDAEISTYECTNCRSRVHSDDHPVTCDACGGEMRNISKPRGR